MLYLRVDTNKNNSIIEFSGQPYSGSTKDGEIFNNLLFGEIQVESNYNFPIGQKPYFYKWNGSSVVENDEEYVDLYLKGVNYYKIYDYIPNLDESEYQQTPANINYDIVGLNKKRIFNKGELVKTEYYGYVDSGNTYQDLILTEYRDYYRKDRMVYFRLQKTDWYLKDGSVGDTKITKKYYILEESIKLGETRRRNIISSLKINTIGLIQMISGITQTEATLIGMGFLSEVTNEITQFVEGLEEPLKNSIITNTNHNWLDNEIPNSGGIIVRDYLYESIDVNYDNKIYVE